MHSQLPFLPCTIPITKGLSVLCFKQSVPGEVEIKAGKGEASGLSRVVAKRLYQLPEAQKLVSRSSVPGGRVAPPGSM